LRSRRPERLEDPLRELEEKQNCEAAPECQREVVAGGSNETMPTRMAAVAPDTHHNAPFLHLNAAKSEAPCERLTSTKPKLVATSEANVSERASSSRNP
jgi:hypothetical protein